MDFSVGHIFAKNRTRPKAMVYHDFGSKFNRHQNGHHWNSLFMLITMVQIPASYLLPSLRYLAKLLRSHKEAMA